jgi:polysaccharide biosynthesis/export protein
LILDKIDFYNKLYYYIFVTTIINRRETRPLIFLTKGKSIRMKSIKQPFSIYARIISAVLIILGTGSCTQRKHLVYFNHPTVDTATYNNRVPVYKIQKQDVLYVKVFSLSLTENDMFNLTPNQAQGTTMQSDASIFINGFAVNDSGFVALPVMGKVKVEGKTVDEAQDIISQRLAQYFKDATVIVKLLSFKVSVLGEVARPGVFRNYNNSLTILDALSLAGDVTQYGSRRNVMVIRCTPKGNQTYRINLTNPSVLASEAYFLQPNDVVYVEPIPTKTLQVNIPTYSVFLSTITTLVLLLNYIK